VTPTMIAFAATFALLLGILGCLELGRRIGMANLARTSADTPEGASTIDAAIFTLLGLLIAFTFSGGATRFEDRRHLVREEVNAIGTAYLRLDMLPQEPRQELHKLFVEYTNARARLYENIKLPKELKAKVEQSGEIQKKIWEKAVAACLQPRTPTQTSMLLLPALNEMIDITTTQAVATQNHPPFIIFFLLGLFSFASAMLAGYGMARNKNRSWLHMLVFAIMMSFAVYVILDLEFPRMGLIRIDAADQLFYDLLKSMKS
jgi:hypothetical protein